MPITLNRTAITLGQAKTSVARAAGAQNDTDQLTVAGEVIRDVLLDLNARRDWTWLQMRNSTQAYAVNGTVGLPSRYKKIYSVTIPGQPALGYINQRDLDRQTMAGENFGGTYFYSDHSVAEESGILLIDPPAVGTIVTIDYHRMTDLPTLDANAFDLPETAMPYLLAQSKAEYIASKGGSPERLQYFMSRAAECYRAILIDDQRKLDEDAAFTPSSQVAVMPLWRWAQYGSD